MTNIMYLFANTVGALLRGTFRLAPSVIGNLIKKSKDNAVLQWDRR